MKKPADERKVEEDKMKAEWGAWMQSHRASLDLTAGAGKTKRVTSSGITDVKNDIMLYSVAEGESHDAVATLFKDHPHFGIPGAWIEVMPINRLPGMDGM